MLYVHENNLKNKINTNYNGLKSEILDFYTKEYLPMRNSVLDLVFSADNKENFKKATDIFNTYYSKLLDFSKKYGVKSQSKFESTFLEEMSTYLVKDIDETIL